MGASNPEEHRRAAPTDLSFAVVTMSDTRTLAQDRSGDAIVELMQQAGYGLRERRMVPDEPSEITRTIADLLSVERLDAIITTGGTGVSPRDQTPEAIQPMLDIEIPGFGEIFRTLSWQEVGPAAMLSRAFAGRIGSVLVFCLPGSTAAVRLAVGKLIAPELPHLVHHAR